MKLRHLLVFASFFLVLAAGVLIKTFTRPARPVSLYAPLEIHFNPEDAEKIVLRKGTGEPSVELEKIGNAWKVGSLWKAEADSEKIKKFLKTLNGLQGEKRSEDSSLLGDYGINDEEAFRLEVMNGQGKALADLLTGVKTPEFGVVFVRKAGSDAVYAAARPLFSLMGVMTNPAEAKPEGGFWVLASVFRQATGQITGIQVRELQEGVPLSEVELVRKSGEGETPPLWEFASPQTFEPDNEKVSEYLRVLESASATRVVDPKAAYGFDKASRRVLLKFKEREAVTLDVAGGGGPQPAFFLRNSSLPEIFEIPFYTAERLAPEVRFFYKANPFNLKTAGIREILIKAGGKEIFLGLTEDRKPVLEKVGAVLETLESHVQALKASGPEEELFSEIPYRIEIHPTYGAPWILEIGTPSKASGGRYPLRVSGREGRFTIDAGTLEALLGPVKPELEAAPASSPGDVQAPVQDGPAPAAEPAP